MKARQALAQEPAVLVIALAAMALGQCLFGCQRPVTPPVVEPDGGFVTGDCELAEQNLSRLGCEGDGYAHVCELATDLPGVVDVACLASAEDCIAASLCDAGD